MCEYDPNCSKRDDPLAILLWTTESRRRSVWMSRCPKGRCPLAAVFDIPPRGLVLVTPPHTMLRRSIYVDPDRPNELEHMHAAAIDLSAYEDGEPEQGKCSHGTWAIDPRRLIGNRFGTKAGIPYTTASYIYTADDPRNPRHSGEEVGGDERQ